MMPASTTGATRQAHATCCKAGWTQPEGQCHQLSACAGGTAGAEAVAESSQNRAEHAHNTLEVCRPYLDYTLFGA